MTTLVKRSVLPEFETMERRFRRMVEGFPFGPALLPSTLIPACDVYETPQEVVVELEVPGYEEKELSLELADHTLTISGSRAELGDESERTFRVHERLERTFERSFSLPPEIDAEHVTARFAKGVLAVHAPKLATARQRTVPISS